MPWLDVGQCDSHSTDIINPDLLKMNSGDANGMYVTKPQQKQSISWVKPNVHVIFMTYNVHELRLICIYIKLKN